MREISGSLWRCHGDSIVYGDSEGFHMTSHDLTTKIETQGSNQCENHEGVTILGLILRDV